MNELDVEIKECYVCGIKYPLQEYIDPVDKKKYYLCDNMGCFVTDKIKGHKNER